MTVDLDIIDTWPNESREILTSNINEIIKAEKNSLEHDMSDEKYTSEDTGAEFIKQIKTKIAATLKPTHVRIFHATRTTDPDSIKNEGLKTLNIQDHIERVVSAVQIKKGAEVARQFTAALKNYTVPQGEIREGQVCFFNYRQATGTDDLLNYFGGECIRKALEHNNHHRLVEILKEIGEPKIIVIRYPFQDIEACTKDSFADNFIQTYKKINGFKSSGLGSDIFTKEDIDPNLIEDIIDPRSLLFYKN